ncbi:MAG: iron-containing alcohol dehydrogenase [Desulfobacteraceae bacterium]|nr:iron-containing alcohol dehydrogenase [Desulfobacteraceae bacterium]MBC2757107.1 iron-containing alcohol dehydrogenase [Desulfobacteraceae bacterium]MBC2763677.1 iron-containing alcohol dehydrogenase [ANME-2 cluster archaeon]
MLPEFFEFYNPTKVVYEDGVATDLKPELDIIGIKKYFIVSDQIINDLGMIKKVADGLVEAGCEVTGQYLDVKQDARLNDVKTCADLAKTSGAEGILSIGGGSVIDTAKAANILFSEGGDLVDDYSGAHTLTRPLKPHVVIPTTAGTGSEVTMIAVIYDEENKEKLAFPDKFLLPNLAVLDPQMTISLPPKMTAATGMDALTHAVEAYVGPQASPISDAFAIGAIELIMKNLVNATRNGEDVNARGAMLIASSMAGISFTHSMCGCVHGMAHATGGLYRVPHGVANGIFLPFGMEYNFEEIKEKLARLAPVMGEDISGLSEDEAAKLAIAAVRKLSKQLNELDALPLRLRDVGVPEDGLEAIAEGAINDGTSFYNPREMDEEELLPYIQKAY